MRPSVCALLFLLACSSSDADPSNDSDADVVCSINDRTIRCDRRFDPMVDASDAYEHTALHLVLAEPLDAPLAFEGSMDLVWVLFHQVWAREPADPEIDGFEPAGIFTEAQFLMAGINEATTRIDVSGELTPRANGCVDIELRVLAEITHDWSASACPR